MVGRIYPLENPDGSAVNLSDLIEGGEDNEESYQKKLAIISSLPPNFVNQVKDYVRGVEKECDRTGEGFDLESRTRGRVFEMLVKAEFYEDDDTARSKISNEIQNLIINPGRYRLDQFLKLGRIPDVVHVQVSEEGRHVSIVHAIEAKIGSLDRRSMRQLKDSSFLYTFRCLTKALNILSKKSLEECGLENLANAKGVGNTFSVAPDFDQRLVVPADTNINFPDGLIKTDEFEAHEKDNFVTLLKSIKIQNSSFNRNEISAIARYILEKD